MNARTEGWVTVAAAAAALSAAGDPIDPSNVSRYLARFPEIASVKEGRCRFVNMAALAKHRDTNILVADKRGMRDQSDVEELLEPQAHGGALKRRHLVEDDGDDEAPGQPSAINQANVRLKNLSIRERETDWQERIGKLVPDTEVLALVSGTMTTFIGELERQEGLIAARLGREAAAEFRRCRKAAQTAASAKLIELSRQLLKPDTADLVLGSSDEAAAA